MEELDIAKESKKKRLCVNRLMDKIPPLIIDLACEDVSFNHLSNAVVSIIDLGVCKPLR